ncbi:phosphatase PAP2 family protein [Diaminobutyricibacter tongyongensis]|uniref:Phosphatase PAP2 family protein n=1 Tax=Leifsonia tongyongensis TaxID=1268043 RepID=A0A6L9XW27_9MICO|nr:phosphatase PAP2 family protein [Diaminobutyricibacter tongyongensis]
MGTQLRATPFLLGALASAAVFVAVYLVFVRSYMGQVVDERAFAGADVWKGSLVDFAHSFLNILPIAAVVVASIMVIIIVVVRRNWLVFVVAVAAAVLANLSTQVLKYGILSRPEKGVDVLSNSLPSGHTTVAASAALVVFLVTSPRFRPLAAVLGSTFSIVTGASTLVEQWHRPSDVVAGLLVVSFWGCLAGCALAWLHVRTAEIPVRAKLWPLFWVAVGLAVVGIISLIVTYISAQSGGSHLFVAYVGGVAAMGAVGFAIAVAGNRLFAALP